MAVNGHYSVAIGAMKGRRARSAEAHALGARDSIGVGGLRSCLNRTRSTCRAATPSRSGTRELLAPVYGWFTEGFDTLNLKEAKALLDGLAP